MFIIKDSKFACLWTNWKPTLRRCTSLKFRFKKNYYQTNGKNRHERFFSINNEWKWLKIMRKKPEAWKVMTELCSVLEFISYTKKFVFHSPPNIYGLLNFCKIQCYGRIHVGQKSSDAFRYKLDQHWICVTCLIQNQRMSSVQRKSQKFFQYVFYIINKIKTLIPKRA
jgi:hypothetical protein